MKKRKNLYAVYFLDGRKDNKQIYYTWEEEQRATFHIPHMMHGFETEKEAEAWFKTINAEKIGFHKQMVKQKKVEKAKKLNKEHYEVYLDEKHSKVLKSFLKQRNIDLSDYLAEIIELDMMNQD